MTHALGGRRESVSAGGSHRRCAPSRHCQRLIPSLSRRLNGLRERSAAAVSPGDCSDRNQSADECEPPEHEQSLSDEESHLWTRLDIVARFELVLFGWTVSYQAYVTRRRPRLGLGLGQLRPTAAAPEPPPLGKLDLAGRFVVDLRAR
jgi:hypothetical protein